MHYMHGYYFKAQVIFKNSVMNMTFLVRIREDLLCIIECISSRWFSLHIV